MQDPFPAVGHEYLVDFKKFRVILSFASETLLTYTVLNSDGSSGQVETVNIRVEKIVNLIFLVTWQEADKTTVVHVENYANNTIVTNIANPDGNFGQFHGTFKEIDKGTQSGIPNNAPCAMVSNDRTADPIVLTYTHDIRPLFRDGDISCMARRRVMLADAKWMCVPKNANDVYAAISSGDMPPDSPWPQDRIALFKAWMDGGLNP
jgi:hypothetical protein